MIFVNREDAGERLAQRLLAFRDRKPIVLALPRGGVVVGFEVARVLNAPMDVLVARKLGAPDNPELGIGAVAPGGGVVLDEYAIRTLGITQGQIDRVVERETAEMERRVHRYRGDRPAPVLTGRTVILVDDGMATGVTARAAARSIRRADPAELVLAVPVCAAETARSMLDEVDRVVCVTAPHEFRAVGLWYRHFDQTSDEEVVELLDRARESRADDPRPGGESSAPLRSGSWEGAVRIRAEPVNLDGDLRVPAYARGIVLFAHGSGSSRRSARNRRVAAELNEAGLATLLFDLLTSQEAAVDDRTRELRFDVELLARRVIQSIDWLEREPLVQGLPVGLFGASTGAAAALVAAAERPGRVAAVVSRGGRPDLAGGALSYVKAPTLLIVGGNDVPVLELNHQALEQLDAEKRLSVIPDATHLFEEPGALELAAAQARDWFLEQFDRIGRERSVEPAGHESIGRG